MNPVVRRLARAFARTAALSAAALAALAAPAGPVSAA